MSWQSDADKPDATRFPAPSDRCVSLVPLLPRSCPNHRFQGKLEMNPRIRILCLIAVIVATVSFCSSAQAQRPAHYYPARPTFSPYLLYRQVNATSIPNYYTYVQPARSVYQDSFVSSREAPRIQRQQTLLRQDEVNQIIEGRLGLRVSTGVGQPSQAATFLNTSHYFPTGTVPRRR